MKIRYPIVCTKDQREQIKKLLHEKKKFKEENADVVIMALKEFRRCSDERKM